MKIFVENGGFIAINKYRVEEVERVQYKDNLEISQLELVVRTAQEAELNSENSNNEARSSRIATWVSTAAAIGVLLWEIIKSIK